MTCLFCRIVRHELPATVRRETEQLIAFDDIHPKAPVHILVVPKVHRASLDGLTTEDRDLAGVLMLTVADLARETGIAATGYRVILNTGTHGGQEVDHLHVHLLGGKRLEPMG